VPLFVWCLLLFVFSIASITGSKRRQTTSLQREFETARHLSLQQRLQKYRKSAATSSYPVWQAEEILWILAISTSY
jgi:hypothetical protein